MVYRESGEESDNLPYSAEESGGLPRFGQEQVAEELPHARASRGEAVMWGRVVHIFIRRSPGGAGDDGEDSRSNR